MEAVSASLIDWQIQIILPPQSRGSVAIIIGGQMILLDRDVTNAFFVFAVACQNEIIKMLKPARKNPQK